MVQEKVYIIYFTESSGRRYIVTVTNNPEKWIKFNNHLRDNDEELTDFEIVEQTLYKF